MVICEPVKELTRFFDIPASAESPKIIGGSTKRLEQAWPVAYATAYVPQRRSQLSFDFPEFLLFDYARYLKMYP